MPSFNVQNAKSLEITEGDVATIHDADGRQLWGKLNYTTKYQGDTEQTTSPAPDNPQPISVVTGTQTVTLTGGTVSEDYTLHLGTLELAKLGTYQDYIYKDSGKWYKHAIIGLYQFDGTENFSKASISGRDVYYSDSITDYARADNVPIGNYFSGAANVSGASSVPADSMCFGSQEGQNRFYLRYDGEWANSSALTTWLTTNTPIIYYALATATDTEITDTDLIAELDAIEEWMTRCGYTASVAGNLPIVINQTEIV